MPKTFDSKAVKRRRRYGYSFGVAFCLSDHTWVEKQVAFYAMSYTEPSWDQQVGLAIAVAKEMFEDLGKQSAGVATTWGANFIVPEMKDMLFGQGAAIYL